MHSCARGGSIFTGITKICANDGYLCWLYSEMKNNSLKYEKSENLTFEILIRVNKLKFTFYLRAREIVSNIFWVLLTITEKKTLKCEKS